MNKKGLYLVYNKIWIQIVKPYKLIIIIIVITKVKQIRFYKVIILLQIYKTYISDK
jgi:hypothetical protein